MNAYALAASLRGTCKIRVPSMQSYSLTAALLLIDQGLLADMMIGLIIIGIALYLYNGFRNIPSKMQKQADSVLRRSERLKNHE